MAVPFGGAWALCLPPEPSPSTSAEPPDPGSSAAKLPHPKFPCFGSCPARDAFILVRCPECGLRLKPVAIRNHYASRHPSKCSLGRKLSDISIGKDDLTADSYLLSPILHQPSTSRGGRDSESERSRTPDGNIFEQLLSGGGGGGGGGGGSLGKTRSGSKTAAVASGGKKAVAARRVNGVHPRPKAAKALLPPRVAKRNDDAALERLKRSEIVSALSDSNSNHSNSSESLNYVVKRSSLPNGKLTLTFRKTDVEGAEEPPPKPRGVRTNRRKQDVKLSPGDSARLLRRASKDPSPAALTPPLSRPAAPKAPGPRLAKPLSFQEDAKERIAPPPAMAIRSGRPAVAKAAPPLLSKGALKGPPSLQRQSAAPVPASTINVLRQPCPVGRSTFGGHLIGSLSREKENPGPSSGIVTYNRRLNSFRLGFQLAIDPSASFCHENPVKEEAVGSLEFPPPNLLPQGLSPLADLNDDPGDFRALLGDAGDWGEASLAPPSLPPAAAHPLPREPLSQPPVLQPISALRTLLSSSSRDFIPLGKEEHRRPGNPDWRRKAEQHPSTTINLNSIIRNGGGAVRLTSDVGGGPREIPLEPILEPPTIDLDIVGPLSPSPSDSLEGRSSRNSVGGPKEIPLHTRGPPPMQQPHTFYLQQQPQHHPMHQQQQQYYQPHQGSVVVSEGGQQVVMIQQPGPGPPQRVVFHQGQQMLAMTPPPRQQQFFLKRPPPPTAAPPPKRLRKAGGPVPIAPNGFHPDVWAPDGQRRQGLLNAPRLLLPQPSPGQLRSPH